MNQELLDVQARFRKGRGIRDQIANICWMMEKAREFQKNMHFFFIDYTKDLDCVDHNKLWNILKEIGIPDHLTCLLRKIEGRSRRGSQRMRWLVAPLTRGHDFEQAPGVGEGQGSLVRCSPWSHKKSDRTERLN